MYVFFFFLYVAHFSCSLRAAVFHWFCAAGNTNTTNQMSIFCFRIVQLASAKRCKSIFCTDRKTMLCFSVSHTWLLVEEIQLSEAGRGHTQYQKMHSALGRLLWKHNTLQVTDYQLNSEALGKLNLPLKSSHCQIDRLRSVLL